MVPAESILNLESKPLFLTASVKTPSAAGLLQMLPRHTKRTEKGLVWVSADDGPEAIGEDANTTGEDEMVGVWRRRVVGLGFRRDGREGRGRNDGSFRERKRGWWQNGKLRWGATASVLLYKALMLPSYSLLKLRRSYGYVMSAFVFLFHKIISYTKIIIVFFKMVNAICNWWLRYTFNCWNGCLG